jgi:hypothetical protein
MAEALGAALQKRVQQPPKVLLQKWMRELKPLAEAQPKEPVEAELALDEKKGEKQFLTQVPKAPRGRWWMAGAAAALLAGAGVLASWPRHPVSVSAPVSISSHEDLAPAVVKGESPRPTEAIPVDPPRLAVKPKPHPRPPAPAPRPAAPVSPPPAPATTTGHLLVGGEGALRAEIRIDGDSRGFAPKLLELPAGPHEVELLLPTGSHLKKRITLAESNTPSAPLRWLVP